MACGLDHDCASSEYHPYTAATAVSAPEYQHWYTKNALDQRQERAANTSVREGEINGAVELFKSTRLVLPQRLVIFADKSWILVKDPAPTTEYLFISWHWESFKYEKNKPSKEALSLVKEMAQHATLETGLKAYWLDVQCVDQESGQSFSSDVYGMADIVRNATHVAVLLPSEHSFYKRAWARRLWTLSEGLLAKGRLHIWTATEDGFTKSELDRVEMIYEFWHPFANDERHYPTRILAEYFEGQTELTRLEMIVTAIAALSRQDSSKFTDADIAYALMGLLRKPMTIERSDTLYQAMTKLLSLTGENEYVMERMLSTYPFPAKDFKTVLRGLLNKDQFHTYLWDIRPNCEIVGIDGIDGVVYFNNCRTLPICHRFVPEQTGERFRIIEPLRGPATLLLCLLIYGLLHMLLSSSYTACVFLLCTLIFCLRDTRPADSAEGKHDFVLLEGVLPLSQLEKAVFGESENLLTYATSSSPLNAGYHDNNPSWVEPANLERWTEELYTARKSSNEPYWIQVAKPGPSPASPVSPISPLLRQTSASQQQKPHQETYHPPLLAGHTMFTLMQISTGQVSLIQARLPPTTLVLTGEEGGMPPPQVRREARVTLIEDEVQVNIPTYHYPAKLTITSPISDDVPTPRGLVATITPATDATSEVASMWSQRSSKSSFDSLYDLTDSEGEEVPLKLSASVKKHVVDKERSKYPSLVIPSPSQWPSIHKPHTFQPVGLSPATKLASPSAFSVWQAQRLRVSSGTSTPSLDGSLTSEELALSSCPSTPDLASRVEVVDDWEPPCQLHPDAFQTLHQLSPEEAANETIETVLEVPEEAAHEMSEIIKITPVRLDFALLSVNSEDQQSQDPISALSVPSPGGFFSSLAPVAAQTWAIKTPEPSTSVAENFYGVPWRGGAARSSEHHPRVTTTIITSAFSPLSQGPPTAIKDVFSPIDRSVEICEIIDVCGPPSEYNEQYQEKLKQSALAHFERTKGWLEDQFAIVTVVDDGKKVAAPSTPDMTSPSTVSAASSPSKKSVRFAPEAAASPKPSTNTTVSAPTSPSADTVVSSATDDTDHIFLDGFRSIMSRHKPTDAFVHRQPRLESTHIMRRNFSVAYLRTVHNSFSIAEPSRPISTRPISTMLPAPSPEDDAKREVIAAVERERSVLEQVFPQTWELEALAFLRGGSLLTKEINAYLSSLPSAQVLDFAGKPNADWGWSVATSYPLANVSTVYFDPDTGILDAPSNFVAVEADKPFALPFADNTFDIISARTLHSLLKSDQWSVTLSELHRVLKPSGYLDFSVLDALLINVSAGSWGQVMNAEFGHKLQQRGYEREPTKQFLGRLETAGFKDVKRMWMFLGMGDVQPIWKDEGKSPVAKPPTRPLPAIPGAGKKPTTGKRRSVSAKSPATPKMTSPIVGSDGKSKPKGTIHYQVPIRDAAGNILLGPDGKPTYYPPALTGSTSAVAPVTGLMGARLWEQWVYKLAREMGGEEAELQMLEQVCGVLEQGGKTGSGIGCLMGVCRK
ncbi:hypothetical protein QM012_004011 [Aureobasidium pullulans]|uniref:Methyltransferase type 11 domain-containing protein n=1 Tax=Aureobasidium pullulans TaxID=5580 RepID=A0ABR0T6G1_AURPU